jgi:hypothetical protein
MVGEGASRHLGFNLRNPPAANIASPQGSKAPRRR